MAKRLSRRKTMKRKNTLRRKTMRRKNTLRKTMRRKNIKKRGGVTVRDDSLTRTKEFLTRYAKQLVGPLKNCSDVFLANGENYPHIVSVSFDEGNQRMSYDLNITLNWSERAQAEKFDPGLEPLWKDDAYFRKHESPRTKVYRANKSYTDLYSDCDRKGIDFFTTSSEEMTKSRGEKIKAYLDNSFGFMSAKKNKDEECEKRLQAIENVVSFYEKEMNELLKDVSNLTQIEGYLSSLAWISEEERAREREERARERSRERARKRETEREKERKRERIFK